MVLLPIVTAFVAWREHQRKWIQRRHDFLSTYVLTADVVVSESGRMPNAPGLLSLFGEPGHYSLCVIESKLAEARELFPEARRIGPPSPQSWGSVE
jgi:hypothetical protein